MKNVIGLALLVTLAVGCGAEQCKTSADGSKTCTSLNPVDTTTATDTDKTSAEVPADGTKTPQPVVATDSYTVEGAVSGATCADGSKARVRFADNDGDGYTVRSAPSSCDAVKFPLVKGSLIVDTDDNTPVYASLVDAFAIDINASLTSDLAYEAQRINNDSNTFVALIKSEAALHWVLVRYNKDNSVASRSLRLSVLSEARSTLFTAALLRDVAKTSYKDLLTIVKASNADVSLYLDIIGWSDARKADYSNMDAVIAVIYDSSKTTEDMRDALANSSSEIVLKGLALSSDAKILGYLSASSIKSVLLNVIANKNTSLGNLYSANIKFNPSCDVRMKVMNSSRVNSDCQLLKQSATFAASNSCLSTDMTTRDELQNQIDDRLEAVRCN